jgi:hypothetical protein
MPVFAASNSGDRGAQMLCVERFGSESDARRYQTPIELGGASVFARISTVTACYAQVCDCCKHGECRLH